MSDQGLTEYSLSDYLEPAGLFRRFKAFAVDVVVTCPAAFLAWKCLPVFSSATASNALGFAFAVATWFFLFGAYCSLMESSRAMGTVGKKLLGMEVLDLEYERITVWQGVVRTALVPVSALAFMHGFFVAFFSPGKETFHDWASRTSVMVVD